MRGGAHVCQRAFWSVVADRHGRVSIHRGHVLLDGGVDEPGLCRKQNAWWWWGGQHDDHIEIGCERRFERRFFGGVAMLVSEDGAVDITDYGSMSSGIK